MRSNKSRSRSKSNRQRSMGNIVNRVFDSSGPEGKVRGTPQQIIDKYNQLARDASLGNDRVAAENFQQHAEHYARMLGEAQREQDARREQQEQQQRDRQRERHDGAPNGQQPQSQSEPEALQAVEPGNGRPHVIEDEIHSPPQPDLLGEPLAAASGDAGGSDTDTGLVDTPESKAKPRRPRSRKPKPETSDAPDEAAPKPRRARKPKPEAAPTESQAEAGDGSPTTDSPEAAE